MSPKCHLSHQPQTSMSCNTDANHIHTYAFVEGCKDLTLVHWAQSTLTHKHTLSLGQMSPWWSCITDGQGRCTLPITEVISIPLRGWKSCAWRTKEREIEGPWKTTLLDGGTLRSIYNKLPASAFPTGHDQTPLGVRACASRSVFVVESISVCG